MGAAVLAQVVQHLRRVGEFVRVLLAVEYAQGVALEALVAGLAQGAELAGEVLLQSRLIGPAALGTADGVDAHAQPLDAARAQNVQRQSDDLRVHGGVLGAKDLHAVLVELAQPPRLRLLIAEVGAGDVVEFAGQRLGEQVVLDEGARHARRAFGLEGDGAPALVLEGVHLLLHHVCAVAHAAREQLRVLEHRRADLAVAGQRTYRAHGRLDLLPAVRVAGQHVLRSLGRLRKHLSLSFPWAANKKASVPM